MNERQLEEERVRYVNLCLACREQGHQVLDAELRDASRALDRLGQELSRLIPTLQARSDNWLQHWLRPKALERLAATEFDALAQSPYVAEVDFDKANEHLLVTTVPVAANDMVRGSGPSSSLRLDIILAAGTLTAEPSLNQARRSVLAPIATLLVTAGDLRGLVALVVEGFNPDLVPPGAARVTSYARRAYIRCRTALLMQSQANDKLQHKTEARLASITRQVSNLVRRMCLIERALDTLQGIEGRTVEEYGREFDLLRQLPKVYEITVDSEAIVVCTEPIVLSVGGNRYQIGRFRVAIYPGARVEMRNLDKPIRSSNGRYDHPHVCNGQPCWGDSQTFFATQLAQHNFPAIIQQAVEFLGSYNPHSPFVGVEKWA